MTIFSTKSRNGLAHSGFERKVTLLAASTALALVSWMSIDSIQAKEAMTVEHQGVHIVRSIEVQYDDLDLRSATGQQQLQQRIERASREVCGNANIRNERADYMHCLAEAKQSGKAGFVKILAANGVDVKKIQTGN